ncbi:hypothetical protein BCR35DRAFT_74868 [Leucosporidium creatinivorum]|uniref:Uncharacterized protein n=1 Tax=Leucosporidium creatinivorum TaxID=106004 RepID=A0A1Y2G4K5_9BASI|nr:hypothetical protein BCR35DRAFT_74868 [Leucosporidium creatinivorum]
MPPLETISDDEPFPPQASTSATNTAPNAPSPTVLPRSSSADSMPPLETIHDPGQEGDAEDEDDDDYETEEDDEDDYDTYDDEDDYDEDEDSDDEAIYPDGLPLDPLLPLLYLSRPFLHTARKKLYRRINLVSVWQASLLLRSLKAPQHAARNAVEDSEDPDGDKNHLAHLVRSLNLDARGDMSLGRGGAEVYFELMNMCKNLEEIRILPSLLKSATKPFLATLRSLTKLKKVDLASGTDPEKPFVLTTARVIRLMRESWPELEELVAVGLKGSDFGPVSEQSIMWDEDLEDMLLEGNLKAMFGGSATQGEKRSKPKGLKTLKLLDPDAYEDELSLLLKHSADTLIKLQISRPSQELSRWGLASIFLNYGSNLTSVVLDCPGSWQPMAKPTIKRAFPCKRKDYKAGAPSDKDVSLVS